MTVAEHRGYRLRYGCRTAELPAALAERFRPAELDDETRAFIDRAGSSRHGRVLGLLHRALRGSLSDFDVNGILGMYPMHLLGSAGWRRLLGDAARGSLLDVGAGSGDVTITLAPAFDRITTTETSRAMAWRLRRRGLACVRCDLARDPLPAGPFDVVSCLNVLDRTARPRTLLHRLGEVLAPGGALVLALPLPYDPLVYDGGATVPPEEPLAIEGGSWEAALTRLVERELRPNGWQVSAFSRAPYLSGGDARRSLYLLDDAVLVCRWRDAAKAL